MEELKNKYAIDDFNFALNQGAVGFYIITASAYMHRRLANSFISDSVAVYDYSGKENADTFSPKELFYFIENNNEKGVFFILNFQIPFLGKQADTTQPDYFALNLCRDILYGYNKKIFFFTTEEIRRNISIAAMDFYDYCFSAIAFKDEQKDEIEQQIKKLNEDYDNIHNKAEIEYRLNLYKDKIDEYLNIDIDKYSNLFIENVKTLTPEEKKSQNYLLVAARDLSYFGRLYEKIGDFDKALELYKKDLDIQEKINGKEHNNTANSYGSIGNVYDSQGNYSKALEYYRKALKIRERILDYEHPNVATCYINIGHVYCEQGDYSKALEYHQKALKIDEKAFGNEHPDVAIDYNNIGYVYYSQGDYSKALEYYQKALKIDEKAFGNEHPNVAIRYNNIGSVYYSQGDYSKALEYYQKALKIRKKVLGSNHPKTINTYNAIEKINSKLHHIS